MVEHPAGTAWRGVYLQALRTFRFPARPSAPVVSISLFHPPSSIFHVPSAFSFSAFQFSVFALGCLVAAATSGSACQLLPIRHPPSSICYLSSAFSFSAFQFSAFALGCLVAAATSGSALKFHPSALPATLNPLPQPPAL
jgi:hypothetical protein